MSKVQSLIDLTYNILRTTLSETETLKSSNTINGFKLESSIKRNLTSISQNIKDIESSIKDLPIHEKSRIYFVVKDLKENVDRIHQNMRPVKKDIEVISRPEEDYSQYSNTDIVRHQEVMKKRQDQDIDKLISTLNNVKTTGKEMGDELEYHIKLLENTESNVDTNTKLIKSTSERMIRLIDRSSNKCLMLAIIILSVLIFLAVFYL
jgi:uncharacterized protein YicC (UPF0701 family)